MKKMLARLFFILSALGTVLLVVFLVAKIHTTPTCSCPPSGWVFQPGLLTAYGAFYYAFIDYSPRLVPQIYCESMRCEPSYYIFPIDIALFAIVFLVIGIALNTKFIEKKLKK